MSPTDTEQDPGPTAGTVEAFPGRGRHARTDAGTTPVGQTRLVAQPLYMKLIVFVVGAASLGSEIALARLVAPYFGASTIVWANTIAVVLVALSLGYWWGGRLADRRPEPGFMCALVLAAAVGLAIVPFVGKPLLDAGTRALDSISVGAFVGSLVAVLLLAAAPVLLLGAITPFALRLSLAAVEDSGTVAGALYGLSTAGSLLGTFLAALVLVPFAGTHRTFLIFALALALAASLGRPRLGLPVALVVGVLIALPAGAIKSSSADGRVIYETETPYQYVRVVQSPDGTRRLELNEGLAVHSLYRPGSFLTGDYWDEFLVLPGAVDARAPSRLAVLGDAAGTTARAYGHYFAGTAVDGVELDGRLTDIGRRFFGLGGPHLRLITADARPFLRQSHTRYDSIFLDAYRQPYIPFYLVTREFFALVRDHLTPTGSLVVNVGHPSDSNQLERAVSATLRTEFPYVMRDASEPTNTIVLASTAPPSAARLAANRLPADLRPIAVAAARRLGPALRGGPVYTDDRAPVEWLVDRSIISYAAGHR
ncbi:MAG TPA: fused MFS/spermidine synthase [Solirubrobacteraceae bacterium]|jgi:spermidine synthase|nr:fused MFS/spermidine synthase [Solirubrobacteraceae bacterium]